MNEIAVDYYLLLLTSFLHFILVLIINLKLLDEEMALYCNPIFYFNVPRSNFLSTLIKNIFQVSMNCQTSESKTKKR